MDELQPTVTLENASDEASSSSFERHPEKTPNLPWLFISILVVSILTEISILTYNHFGDQIFLIFSMSLMLLTLGVVGYFFYFSVKKFFVRPARQQCGEFTLEQPPLGKGGVGQVFRAKKAGEIEITHALKLIHLSQFEGDTRRIKKILKEPKILSNLNHPNIIKIIDVGRERDAVYIVMEYIDGFDLGRVMKRLRDNNERLPMRYLLRVAIAICGGLDYAYRHLLNFVHRDIKPANIMIGFQGEVKILDFGIAKAKAYTLNTNQARGITGTIPYMSPEQINREELDIRSDIFSIGTLIYEMLTGELPFRGSNISETITKICCVEPVPIRQIRPDIDPELEEMVMRALNKDPTERFQTPGEMLEQLENYAARNSLIASDNQLSRFMHEYLLALPDSSENAPGKNLASEIPALPASTGPFRSRSALIGVAIFFLLLVQVGFFFFQIRESMSYFDQIEAQARSQDYEARLQKLKEKIRRNNEPIGPASGRSNQPRPPPEDPLASKNSTPALPVAAQPVCQLLLRTTPAQVTLHLDQQLYRKTEREMSLNLPVKPEYDITLTAPDFAAASQKIACLPGQKVQVQQELQRLKGGLQVVSIPAGAQVIVDGQPQPGQTPLKIEGLSVGQRYQLRLRHPDYQEEIDSISLTPTRAITRYERHLTPRPHVMIQFTGKFLIFGIKIDSTYYPIRGESSLVKRIQRGGTTLFEFEGLRPGRHTLELIPNYPEKYVSKQVELEFRTDQINTIKISSYITPRTP